MHHHLLHLHRWRTPRKSLHGPRPRTRVSPSASSPRRAVLRPPHSSPGWASESPAPSEGQSMRVFLVNPSDVSFGTAVITPRWLYVLAAATPERFGTPAIVDETLERFDPDGVREGDVVGIGIHTANALRGYHVGRLARERGAFVIFGGIHASLFPDEVREQGAAHAVVTGDGEIVWPHVLDDCEHGRLNPQYEGGRISGESFSPARW